MHRPPKRAPRIRLFSMVMRSNGAVRGGAELDRVGVEVQDRVVAHGDVVQPARTVAFQADAIVLRLDEAVGDRHVVGVANVHPVEVGTIAPGREDLEVVDGQPGAFAVNLRPHARIAQGEVADGHPSAAENPQERGAERFLAAHRSGVAPGRRSRLRRRGPSRPPFRRRGGFCAGPGRRSARASGRDSPPGRVLPSSAASLLT